MNRSTLDPLNFFASIVVSVITFFAFRDDTTSQHTVHFGRVRNFIQAVRLCLAADFGGIGFADASAVIFGQMESKQTIAGFTFSLDTAAVSPSLIGCAIVEFAGFIRTAEGDICIGVDAYAVAYQLCVIWAFQPAFHVDGIQTVAMLLRIELRAIIAIVAAAFVTTLALRIEQCKCVDASCGAAFFAIWCVYAFCIGNPLMGIQTIHIRIAAMIGGIPLASSRRRMGIFGTRFAPVAAEQLFGYVGIADLVAQKLYTERRIHRTHVYLEIHCIFRRNIGRAHDVIISASPDI